MKSRMKCSLDGLSPFLPLLLWQRLVAGKQAGGRAAPCLGPQQSLGGLSEGKRQTGTMTQGTVRESSQSIVGTWAAFGPDLAHKHVLSDSHFF